MSALSVVKEYRGMGDSWPKAIGLGILASDAVISVRDHVGSGIFGVGERITNLGEGVRSAQWDTSREQCWRDGVQFGLEMGLTDPGLAQRHVDDPGLAQRNMDEAARLIEDRRATKV